MAGGPLKDKMTNISNITTNILEVHSYYKLGDWGCGGWGWGGGGGGTAHWHVQPLLSIGCYVLLANDVKLCGTLKSS